MITSGAESSLMVKKFILTVVTKKGIALRSLRKDG